MRNELNRKKNHISDFYFRVMVDFLLKFHRKLPTLTTKMTITQKLKIACKFDHFWKKIQLFWKKKMFEKNPFSLKKLRTLASLLSVWIRFAKICFRFFWSKKNQQKRDQWKMRIALKMIFWFMSFSCATFSFWDMVDFVYGRYGSRIYRRGTFRRRKKTRIALKIIFSILFYFFVQILVFEIWSILYMVDIDVCDQWPHVGNRLKRFLQIWFSR